MIDKDFGKWNSKKKDIHNNKRGPNFNEREIWWCLLGTNIGFEHDGDKQEHQRPVLIIKSLSLNTCYIVPLTSSSNTHRFRVPLGIVEDRNASAVISQMRVIDTKRLTEKICYLNTEKFEITRKAIKELL
jgi:mRNA interferase MazF